MNLIARRFQLPIGQGGFHFSSVGETNFIYDCGGGTTKSRKKLITDFFKKDEEIDYFVISHFDEDHYLGYKELKDHIKIKKVITPAYKNNSEIVLRIALSIIEKNDEEEISRERLTEIKNFANFITNGDNSIQITSEINNNPEQDNNFISKENFDKNKTTNHNKNIALSTNYNDLEWIIRFYTTRSELKLENESTDTTIVEIEKIVNKNDITIEDIEKLHKLLKSKFNSTKDSYYKKYKKKFIDYNSISLCMYSGPRIISNKSICLHSTLIQGDILQYGWLGTGDFTFNVENKFFTHYADYLPLVSHLQLPHHGSKENYDLTKRYSDLDKLLDSILIKGRTIIACGENNKYSHPSKEVIDICEKHENKPLIVTEAKNSIVYEELRMHCKFPWCCC